MNPSPPNRWPDGLLRAALNVLAAALALYVAARLIVAVWPVLVGIGGVVLVAVVGWSLHNFRRSRW